MVDQELAIENVLKFLEDQEKRILLLRGYDNEAKIRVALSCLNKEFNKGIIRTSSMSDISSHINRAFNKDILPRNVKSTTNYEIGKMIVNISSYVTHTKNNPKGNKGTFTLIFPVQTALDNPKRYKRILNEIEDSHSSKIIWITTNEWSIDNWDIENKVDEVFFYKVENDNPSIMRNLRNNGAI